MLHYLVLSFQFHNIFLFLVNPAFLVFLPVSLALLRTKQRRYSAAGPPTAKNSEPILDAGQLFFVTVSYLVSPGLH